VKDFCQKNGMDLPTIGSMEKFKDIAGAAPKDFREPIHHILFFLEIIRSFLGWCFGRGTPWKLRLVGRKGGGRQVVRQQQTLRPQAEFVRHGFRTRTPIGLFSLQCQNVFIHVRAGQK